jgi:hypothetical protein
MKTNQPKLQFVIFTNSNFSFYSKIIYYSVSFIFGAITMTAGIIGVPLGSYLSTNFIKRFPRIDPVICAMGLLISAPLIAFSIFFITESPLAAYIAVFIGQVALNCNWAVVADMLLVRICPHTFILSVLLSNLYFPSSFCASLFIPKSFKILFLFSLFVNDFWL